MMLLRKRLKIVAAILCAAFSATAVSAEYKPDVILKVPFVLNGDFLSMKDGIWVQCITEYGTSATQLTTYQNAIRQIAQPGQVFKPNRADGSYVMEFPLSLENLNRMVRRQPLLFRWTCNLYKGKLVRDPDESHLLGTTNYPFRRPADFGTCYRVSGSFTWPDLKQDGNLQQLCF